jgi:hypothetical protein
MDRTVKALVGTMLALSLLGWGAIAQPSGSAASDRISADRWCC